MIRVFRKNQEGREGRKEKERKRKERKEREGRTGKEKGKKGKGRKEGKERRGKEGKEGRKGKEGKEGRKERKKERKEKERRKEERKGQERKETRKRRDKATNFGPEKPSPVQTLYIPKRIIAPAPHPRGLKRDFLEFSESRFQTNSVSTAREDRERPFSALAASEENCSKNPVSIACAWDGLSTASRQHQHVGTRITSGTEQCQK